MSKLEVFSFEDYRDYLSARLQELKSSRKGINASTIAKSMGVDRSFLSHVLSKKRNFDISRFDKMVKAFKLPDRERVPLILMVLKEMIAGEGSETVQALIYTARGSRNFMKVVPHAKEESSPEELELFSDQLIAVIHTLASMHNFKPDPIWIRDRLTQKDVPLKKIKTALDYLIEKKIIRQNAEGMWEVEAIVRPGSIAGGPFAIMRPYFQAASRLFSDPFSVNPAKALAVNMVMDTRYLGELERAWKRFWEDVFAAGNRFEENGPGTSKDTVVINIGGWYLTVAKNQDK